MSSTPELAPRLGIQQRMADLMKDVRYFRATSEVELDRIFRLRYDAYRSEGAIDERSDGRFVDDHDFDPNVFILGIELQDRLVGSIRLHVTTPECQIGPGLEVFRDMLQPLLDKGESYVDPTRFVVDQTVRRNTNLLPFAALRLGSMAADHYDATYMLATVRIEHVPFYDRMCQLKPRSAPRSYPGLKKPICLLYNHMTTLREALHPKFPVFKSSAAERLELYGPATALNPMRRSSPTANDNLAPRFAWSAATELSQEAG